MLPSLFSLSHFPFRPFIRGGIEIPFVRLLQGPWNTSKFMRTNCWRCATIQSIQRKCWTSEMSLKRYFEHWLNLNRKTFTPKSLLKLWLSRLDDIVYWCDVLTHSRTQFLYRSFSFLFFSFSFLLDLFHSSAINCCRTVYIYIQSRARRMQEPGVKYWELHWRQPALVKSAGLPGCCWHREHRFVSIIVLVFRLFFSSIHGYPLLACLCSPFIIFIMKFTQVKVSLKFSRAKEKKIPPTQMGNSLSLSLNNSFCVASTNW